MPAREGRGWPKSTTDDYKPVTRLTHFVRHLHGSGAGSLKPQIYEALSMLGDKNMVRNQREAHRKSRRRSRKRFRRRTPRLHLDNMFNVISTRAKLPKNTMFSKKYKITIDGPLKRVRKQR